MRQVIEHNHLYFDHRLRMTEVNIERKVTLQDDKQRQRSGQLGCDPKRHEQELRKFRATLNLARDCLFII